MNPVDTLRAKLRAELAEAKKKLAQKFTCFRCRDGNTPLYCLNCAEEVNKDGKRVWWLSVPKRGLAFGFTEKERVENFKILQGFTEHKIVKVREEKE